jgi:hypothetical protein
MIAELMAIMTEHCPSITGPKINMKTLLILDGLLRENN